MLSHKQCVFILAALATSFFYGGCTVGPKYARPKTAAMETKAFKWLPNEWMLPTDATDPNTAAKIVVEAIDQVTTLRGRLGAFQKTTLDTNIAALNDTLVNLTDARSEIRDADFAVETANLTRSQILVQSGTSVLQIANSNPQNVLALLR